MAWRDLGTLLAERFDASRAGPSGDAAAARTGRIPAPYTDAVGREFEVTALNSVINPMALKVFRVLLKVQTPSGQALGGVEA